MVEVGGVEPPSESTLTGLSPGADGYCGNLLPCSPSGRQAVTPAGQVRVMMRGTVNSFRTHGRHINDAFPGLWPLRFRRPPLIRQQQQQCCCYLIYKLPVLWRSGTAARWSRLHTPVETGTPPRRYKLRFTRFRLKPKARTAPFVSPLPIEPATLGFDWILGGSVHRNILRDLLFEIITHFAVEMCYDSVTFFFFQVLVNFTISLTGVTLARTR